MDYENLNTYNCIFEWLNDGKIERLSNLKYIKLLFEWLKNWTIDGLWKFKLYIFIFLKDRMIEGLMDHTI